MTSPHLQLRPSPWKHLLLLALACLFVAMGFLLREEYPVGSWLIIVFFGLSIPLFTINLLPGCSYLHLDSAGMTVCTLYRTWNVDWLATSGFFVTCAGWLAPKQDYRTPMAIPLLNWRSF